MCLPRAYDKSKLTHKSTQNNAPFAINESYNPFSYTILYKFSTHVHIHHAFGMNVCSWVVLLYYCMFSAMKMNIEISLALYNMHTTSLDKE